MKCPNCNKEMNHLFKEWNSQAFTTFCDDELVYHCSDEYKCDDCGIANINGKWSIPYHYKPTEKQKKTILFINNHLGMNLEAITKHQCWIDIGKYFDEAKNTSLYKEDYSEDIEFFSVFEEYSY